MSYHKAADLPQTSPSASLPQLSFQSGMYVTDLISSGEYRQQSRYRLFWFPSVAKLDTHTSVNVLSALILTFESYFYSCILALACFCKSIVLPPLTTCLEKARQEAPSVCLPEGSAWQNQRPGAAMQYDKLAADMHEYVDQSQAST